MLLSLIFPGLGHLYARHRWRAIFFWMICGPLVTAPLVSALMFFWPSPQLVAAVALATVALTAICLIDVWRTARNPALLSRKRTPWWGYALFIVGSIGCSFVATSLVPPLSIRTFSIASASMEPSLFVGDFLVAAMAPKFRQDIRYGDIIMFRREETDWIKRVVGLPGDRITFESGNLIINGAAAPLTKNGIEPDLLSGDSAVFLETMPDGSINPIKRIRPNNTNFDVIDLTVPANSYFVLGDNRDRSADSRTFGVVAADAVTGRAAFIYWSSDWARLGQSLTTR